MCRQSEFSFLYVKLNSYKLNKYFFSKENMIENELKILRKVKHPNIIKLVEEYRSKDSVFLIMEFLKVSNNRPISFEVF